MEQHIKLHFNTSYNNNAYLGFMYGDVNGKTYEATHENTNKSTILTNLETWYESKLTSYQNYLDDTIWCNDKGTPDSGYGTDYSEYGAYNRYKSGTPSLICPNDKDDGKLSKFTAEDTTYGNGALDYKIGLLTADEMVYAGLKWYTTNLNLNYLKDGVSPGTYWWSLSPRFFNGSHALVLDVSGKGEFYSGYVSDFNGLRPSLSLKSTTTISSGAGTAASPFVVN